MMIVKSCEFTRGCEYLRVRPIPSRGSDLQAWISQAILPRASMPGVVRSADEVKGKGKAPEIMICLSNHVSW